MSDLFGLEKPHRITDGDEVKRLTTVYDVAVLGIIRGILEDASVPYLVRERGTGSAMRIITGFSLYGSDVFVPTSAYESAKELIAGIEGEEVLFTDESGQPLTPEAAAESVAEETGAESGESEPPKRRKRKGNGTK